jgi:hypothetical protein
MLIQLIAGLLADRGAPAPRGLLAQPPGGAPATTSEGQ